jgi:hypothetical protein
MGEEETAFPRPIGIQKKKYKSKKLLLSATRIAMLQERHGIMSPVWGQQK